MSFAKKTVTLFGRSITLNGISDSDLYFSHIGNDFDPTFSRFCQNFIDNDYVCVDIGANIGMKSLVMSQAAIAGSVIAVEAAPKVAECLALNISENHATNVLIERTALGDRDGTIKFIENSAYGHVSDSGIEVPITTLPALVQRHGLTRLDFVKIDVEGYEFAILGNSLDLLNQHETLILLEMNTWALIANGDVNPKEFTQWLLDSFEYVFVLNPAGASETLLEPVGKNEWRRLLHQNIVTDRSVTDIVVTNAKRRLSGSSAGLARQLATMTDERDRLRNELDYLRRERDALLASRSWRVTAPLRAFKTLRKPG